jgi:hypothetical protein
MSRFNAKSFVFGMLVVPMMILIVGIVNAQGVRVSIVTLAMKLYKVPLPGFSYLEHIKNLRDLDLAFIFAMFMLVAVWFLSTALVEILLFGVQSDERLNMRNHLRFLYSLAAAILIVDTCMFYRGISDQGGLLDATGGLTPVFATIGYTGLLAFVAYFHVILKHRIF